METNKNLLLAGILEGLIVALALVPIGMSFGVLAVHTGLSVTSTTLMSLSVVAGAAQFAAIGLIASGASILEITFTTFFINLRNFMSGIAIFERTSSIPAHIKVLLAHAITDESCALLGLKKGNDLKLSSPSFVSGAMYTIAFGWVLGSFLGAYSAKIIPNQFRNSLGVGLTCVFISLLVPKVKKNFQLGLISLMSGTINTCLCEVIPQGWSIIISVTLSSSLMIFSERK